MRLFVLVLSASLVLVGGVMRAQAPPPSADRDGIKVHGYWVIEVRNRDGSLAARREFENALVAPANGGSVLLANILGRQWVPGYWYVAFGESAIWGDTRNFGVCGDPGIPNFCFINEGPHQQDGLLTMTVDPTGALHLMGQTAATNPGTLSEVASGLLLCTAAKSPADCYRLGVDFGNKALTRKVLPNPIPVTPGQVLGVSLTISFSS
jgi:hypothetical protein